ncbi:MAG TPA: tryptophan synthase subunit alpha [Pyrinomonadaceae bacterium]|nr:tryptophan synthase subunit alpha [Pyrinomonadaceae bacterium]
MSRIDETFRQLRSRNQKGFIPFVTAGDPDLKTSVEIVLTLAKNGADVIELGVPFSDPVADGPTIQASSQRALQKSVALGDILEMVRELRTGTEIPIVLFSYLNPLYRYGIERLTKDAARAGIDGILITDAVDNEAAEISSVLQRYEIDLISLAAPTTTDERLAMIATRSSGFLYAVSRTGVTGAQKETSGAAEALVQRARKVTDLPIAVGFGISTADQIAQVWKYADAAVVGSAIVKEIEGSISSGNTVERVRNFVAGLLPEVAKETAEI